MKREKTLQFILGPVLWLCCVQLLPTGLFSTMESRSAVGLVLWMSFWWATTPMEPVITALLPIVMNAFFPMIPMSQIIASYSSETIMQVFGASLLVVAWQEIQLDKKLASLLLGHIGNQARRQILFWFVFSLLSSSILPNSVVCATLVPIAYSMLCHVGETNVSQSKLGSKLMVTLLYAITLGGMLTPLGGSMNLVAIHHFEEISGVEYQYSSWVFHFAPLVFLLVGLHLLFLLRDVPKTAQLQGAHEYFQEESSKFAPFTRVELGCLSLFLMASFLTLVRPWYQTQFSGAKPAYIFILFAMFGFLQRYDDGSPVLEWKNIQKNIVWDILYLYAGGIALGELMTQTNASQDMVVVLSQLKIASGLPTIFFILGFTLFLSGVTSNTAAASISLPIITAFVTAQGENPVPYVYIAMIGISLSYALPTSFRALPVRFGLAPSYLFGEGMKLTLLVWLSMTFVCYYFMSYWSYFSTL